MFENENVESAIICVNIDLSTDTLNPHIQIIDIMDRNDQTVSSPFDFDAIHKKAKKLSSACESYYDSTDEEKDEDTYIGGGA